MVVCARRSGTDVDWVLKSGLGWWGGFRLSGGTAREVETSKVFHWKRRLSERSNCLSLTNRLFSA